MAMTLQIPIQLLDAFGAGVYGLTLVTHTGLWWRRRNRPSHFWLASSALGALLVNLTGAAARGIDDPVLLLSALNLFGVAIALASLYELAGAVGGKRPGRFARTMEALILLPPVLSLVTPGAPWMQVLFVMSVMFLLAAMACAARNSRAGDRESRVLAFGLTLLFITLLYDVLSELRVLPRIEGMPVLGFSALYVAAAHALSLRYEREYHELQALRGELELRVQHRTNELEAANRRLDALSRTDSLTGLDNRRSFLESAAARLHAHSAVLVMIDIDHFKQINDGHGHEAGDAALRAVAAALRAALRDGDLLARWGGEEFIALIGTDDAVACAERLRLAVATSMPRIGDIALNISASFGLAHARAQSRIDDAIAAADRALYRAKQQGRNRVVDARDINAAGESGDRVDLA